MQGYPGDSTPGKVHFEGVEPSDDPSLSAIINNIT